MASNPFPPRFISLLDGIGLQHKPCGGSSLGQHNRQANRAAKKTVMANLQAKVAEQEDTINRLCGQFLGSSGKKSLDASRVGQSEPITAQLLLRHAPIVQKQMLGKELYKAIAQFMPHEVGIVTNYMLEMDNSELLMLLEDRANLKCLAMQAKAHLFPSSA